MGPVTTVVQDVNNDGIADLLVANAQSNNVYLLPGVGRGFFNDENPVIYQTGDAPVELFVDHFDDQPGLDLVTVNAQSHDLTFFSGFGPGRTITPGETDAVAALAEDFNSDGTSDLIVASSDGHFTLLLGGSDGPQVTTRLALPNLLNVSDIVLGSLDGTTVEMYASTEGAEVAIPVTFLLDFGPLLPPDGTSPELTLPDTPSSPVAEFSSPAASSLEILVTLLLVPSDAGLSADPGPSSDLGPASDMGFRFDLGPTSQGEPTVGVVASGEAAEEDTEGRMVAEATETTDVERNLLITGADKLPILADLESTEDTERPDAEVPFPSPLELFDFRSKVPCHPRWQEIVAEVSRWTAAGDTSSRFGDQDEHLVPALDPDDPALWVEWAADPEQVPSAVTAAEAEQPLPEEDEESVLPDQEVTELAPWNPSHFPALALWLGGVFLGQNRPAPVQRAQPKNPRRA